VSLQAACGRAGQVSADSGFALGSVGSFDPRCTIIPRFLLEFDAE